MSEKEKLTSEEYIEKRLAEMLKADMDKVPKVHITAEEMEAWVEEDNARRRKQLMKHASIAAVFVLVCVTVLFAMWPGRTAPVGADRDKKIEIDKKGNDAVISDGNTLTKPMNTVWVEKDWENINNLSAKANNLYIPEHYPANFKFQKLILELYSKDVFKAKYLFSGDNDCILQINQYTIASAGANTTYVKGKTKYIDTSKGQAVLYTKDRLTSKATITVANGIISITAQNYNLSEKEYRNIINGLKVIN